MGPSVGWRGARIGGLVREGVSGRREGDFRLRQAGAACRSMRTGPSELLHSFSDWRDEKP